MISWVAVPPLPTASARTESLLPVSIPNAVSDPPLETTVSLPVRHADQLGAAVGIRWPRRCRRKRALRPRERPSRRWPMPIDVLRLHPKPAPCTGAAGLTVPNRRMKTVTGSAKVAGQLEQTAAADHRAARDAAGPYAPATRGDDVAGAPPPEIPISMPPLPTNAPMLRSLPTSRRRRDDRRCRRPGRRRTRSPAVAHGGEIGQFGTLLLPPLPTVSAIERRPAVAAGRPPLAAASTIDGAAGKAETSSKPLTAR